MKRVRLHPLAVLAVCSVLAGCDESAPPKAGPAPAGGWRSEVLWEGPHGITRIVIGDADPDRAGPEIVALDEGGRVLLAGGTERARATAIHEHGVELVGLVIADLDPGIPGPEVYVGGGAKEGQGGVVLQVVVRGGRAEQVRTVADTDGFVHALGALAASEGRAAALVVTDYAGRVLLGTPNAATKPWDLRKIHQEPASDVPGAMQIKDVLVLDPAPGGGAAIVIACRNPRATLIRPDGSAPPEVLHEVPGGVARLGRRNDAILLACNDGRLFSVEHSEEAWKPTALFAELDSLRGVVTGKFPSALGTAPLAVFGFTGRCRLLVDGPLGWDTWTVFRDTDRGHAIATADLVPGNGGDEVVVGGYSGRVTLLTPP